MFSFISGRFNVFIMIFISVVTVMNPVFNAFAIVLNSWCLALLLKKVFNASVVCVLADVASLVRIIKAPWTSEASLTIALSFWEF